MLNKIIVDKNFLRVALDENEDISKCLMRFIDNSIQAKKDLSIENPCKVDINLLENLIVINDNSGGFDSSLKVDDIFKIEVGDYNIVTGLGIKKSLFKLGRKMDIISNNKKNSRKFIIDLNYNSEELIVQSENINYNSSKCEGSTIFISDLNREVNKKIYDCEYELRTKLGRAYSKFINNNKLIVSINGIKLKAKNIELKKLESCRILSSYEVNLYKGNKNDLSGIDLFINDFMIYNRKKGKEVKWNYLNEHKHSYSNCIVEIIYYGDKKNFYLNKEILFDEVIAFIKKNRKYFKSNTVTIQYEMSLDKVENLKEYYDESSAKGVGILAFNKMYENFIFESKKMIGASYKE